MSGGSAARALGLNPGSTAGWFCDFGKFFYKLRQSLKEAGQYLFPSGPGFGGGDPVCGRKSPTCFEAPFLLGSLTLF